MLEPKESMKLRLAQGAINKEDGMKFRTAWMLACELLEEKGADIVIKDMLGSLNW